MPELYKETIDVTRLTRAVEEIERQAREMRHSLDLYARDPDQYSPQLDNLRVAANATCRILERFVLTMKGAP